MTTTGWAYASNKFEPIFMKLLPTYLTRGTNYFHYTNLIACQRILSSKDCISLYASHFLFLNDSAELFDGLKFALNGLKRKIDSISSGGDLFEKLKQYHENMSSLIESTKDDKNLAPLAHAPNHFITCFCSKGNLLNQWARYGGECGVSIEFDLNQCRYEGFMIARENLYGGDKTIVPVHDLPINAYDIIYKNVDKEGIVEKIMNHEFSGISDAGLQAESLAMGALATASFMKHNSFIDEHECRLLFPLVYMASELEAENAIEKLMKYRVVDGVLKPFIKILIKHKDPNELPIKSVTVGPGRNQYLVFNAMIKLIHSTYAPDIGSISDTSTIDSEDYKYVKVGNIEVRRSTIPFRP